MHAHSFHFSSRFYAVTHENMHNFINDYCKGERGLREVEQTGCRHMVDSSTTDEKCSDKLREMQGRGDTKTKREAEWKKEKLRAELQNKKRKMKNVKTEPTNLKKKKRGGVRDWLLLQLAELVLLLLELASQGFVSCHLLCDLRTRTLGAKHKARV